MWLLDTCSIINLSYCLPIATVFKDRYSGQASWVRAVHVELTSQRMRRPPHPQAGRAVSWASGWLGKPIEMDASVFAEGIEAVRLLIDPGGTQSAIDHLGEAASIVALETFGEQWGDSALISDDHGARGEARRRALTAMSTVEVVGRLLAVHNAPLTPSQADTYLDTLRQQERMHAPLTSRELMASQFGPWE